MMKKKLLGADFKKFMAANLADMATSHLETYRDRYAAYGGNKRRMEEDVYINHDTSLEIENAEDELKRKLNDTEHDYLISFFNEEVMKQWERGDF